jgi:hypothetical protein
MGMRFIIKVCMSEILFILPLPRNVVDVTTRRRVSVDRKLMAELRYNLSIFAERKHYGQDNVRGYTV